jgi:hypothetical protein
MLADVLHLIMSGGDLLTLTIGEDEFGVIQADEGAGELGITSVDALRVEEIVEGQADVFYEYFHFNSSF